MIWYLIKSGSGEAEAEHKLKWYHKHVLQEVGQAKTGIKTLSWRRSGIDFLVSMLRGQLVGREAPHKFKYKVRHITPKGGRPSYGIYTPIDLKIKWASQKWEPSTFFF